MVEPVQIAAFGTLISAATLAITLYFRWRDKKSRMKIDYRLGKGEDMPDDWLVATGGPTPTEPVAMFRVENVGARTELLSNAYIDVPNAGTLRQFKGGNLSMPSQLQPGFPAVFYVDLQGFSRNLVNKGCTGTARVDLVIQLGRGNAHTKRVEIPDVEAKAKG